MRWRAYGTETGKKRFLRDTKTNNKKTKTAAHTKTHKTETERFSPMIAKKKEETNLLYKVLSTQY